MKLLVLHSQLGILRGGGENFSRNLFQAFAERGHDVQVAFAADLRGKCPFPLPRAVTAIPVRGIWFETFGQSTLSAIGQQLTRYEEVRRHWDYAQSALAWRTFYWSNRRFHKEVLKRLLANIRSADAVYVHSNAYLARDVARLRPTVLRLPGPLTAEMAPILRGIDAVCANGDALQRIRTFLGDHALELPVGLDLGRFTPGATQVRIAFGWTPEARVIGYVGRLAHIKGVDLLAASFLKVAAHDPTAKLLIVGTGEEATNLRAALGSHISRSAVQMVGDVSHEQLPDFYRAMDVLVMPSRYENYSNAILEGLACGVPFIGSNIGGNQSMAGTGSGWLFDPESAEDLARTLRLALADEEDRRRRGATGRAHVTGRYNWTRTATRLEEILLTIRRPSSPSPEDRLCTATLQ